MSGKNRWLVIFAVLLVFLSALFYFVHYLIFEDPHHIFIYLVGDVAFVPIEVLMVTLIIHRLLDRQQKQSMLRKLNMVIGTFFSEAGTPLLREMAGFCTREEEVSQILRITPQWNRKKYAEARRTISSQDLPMDPLRRDPEELKKFLLSRQAFFVDLLGNPNLIEHEQFSDVMWAVVHLANELQHRKTLEGLPESDRGHLGNDMNRAYSRLILQWLDYMEHLQTAYPYLFSLATRTNPFDPAASVVVT